MRGRVVDKQPTAEHSKHVRARYGSMESNLRIGMNGRLSPAVEMPSPRGLHLSSIGQTIAGSQGFHAVQVCQSLTNGPSLDQPRWTHVPSQTGQGPSRHSPSPSPRHSNCPTAFSSFNLPPDFSVNSMSPDAPSGPLDNSPQPQLDPSPQQHSRLTPQTHANLQARLSPEQQISDSSRDPRLNARDSPSPPLQGSVHPHAGCSLQNGPECNDDPQALRSFPAQPVQAVQKVQVARQSLLIKCQDDQLAEGTDLAARAIQRPALSPSPGNSRTPAVRQGPRIKTTVRVVPAGNAQRPAVKVVASRRMTVSAESPRVNSTNPTAIYQKPQTNSSSPTDRLLSSDASISDTTVTDEEERSPSPKAVASTHRVADKPSLARDELDCSEKLETESPPTMPQLTQQIPSGPNLEHHALPQGTSPMLSSQALRQELSSDSARQAVAPQHYSSAANQRQLVAAEHQLSSMIACSTPMFAGSHGPSTAPEQATIGQQALAQQHSQPPTTSINHQLEQALKDTDILAREVQGVVEGTMTTAG